MALVTNLEESFKERQNVHKKTDASYFTILHNGNKYLQIDTYGSEDREFQGKVSQSIQFSPEAIKQLKNILEKF